MQVSAIICTRNRASQLERALSSLTRMRVPDGLTWELIIVDNGSTDATPATVDAFAGRLPVRRVFEPMAGLSNARNRGVDEARGAYICWTDDDVEVDPEWLAAYADAFRRYPEAAVFGGVIDPVAEVELPQWWRDNWDILGSVLASRDFGPREQPLALDGDNLPFGANFAVRTLEQRRIHFDPRLGVGPHHQRLGEETLALRQLLKDGAKGVWIPSSRVSHLIPAKRTNLAYVASFYRSVGETWAYLSTTANENFIRPSIPPRSRLSQLISPAPLWLWRKLIINRLKELARGRLRSSFNQSFVERNIYKGAIRYYYMDSVL